MKDYIETQFRNLDFEIPDDFISRRELDEAREKAVPTAPENVESSTLIDGYVWWTCGSCGNLQHTDKQARYCADCGQRVQFHD